MKKISSDKKEWTEVIDGFHHKTLVVGEIMSMQKFRIEPREEYGSKHKHANAQIGYVLEGEGLYYITYNENGKNISEEILLKPGDSIYIPPNEYHNAINRGGETVYGIDVFCPPRSDPSPSYIDK